MDRKIHSQFLGNIPSKTWNTSLIIGIEEKHAGNARFYLGDMMRKMVEKHRNLVFFKHGQEQWTSNNFQDQDPKRKRVKRYVSEMEIRIHANDRYRAKQFLVAIMESIFEFDKVYRVSRPRKKDWADD